MMENKPTTRIINIIMAGLFIIIAITLVTIAGSFYTVEQNAKKSGQEQLMRTLNYVTNNLKLVIENRSLSLQQFSQKLPSEDLPEETLTAYLGSHEDQINLLIQLDAEGSFSEAWQFNNGSVQELSEDRVETYLIADPSLKSLIGSGSLVQNSSDYFLENQSFVNLYAPIVAADGQITGYFIAPLNLENMFKEEIFSDTSVYSGYPLVKNADMEVVIHPVESQVGLDIISDRQEQFPDLDLSDLKRLEEAQLTQEEGTLSYYSYWWNEENPTKVLKLGAFEWIDIGAAHWVIALNSDFYEHNRVPIQNNYILLSLLLLISAIILIFILLIRGYNKKNQAYEESQRLIEKQKFENERHQLEKRILKESKLEAIGLLTTTIVHDMNNFLTPILGNAQLLMEDYAENEDLVSELKEIYLAAEKGKDLSTNVLRFSKVSEGQQDTVHDLSQVLKDTISEITILTPKSIKVDSDIAPNILVEGFDKQDLQVVLYNLLTNAFQAIDKRPGNVRIRLKKADAECNADLQKRSIVTKDKEYAVLSITDDGPGIAEGLESNDLFDPFFTTKGSNGSGLGLFVVSSIADKYDWQIRLDRAQKGLTVLVNIPLQKS
ncbi:sensor histidine kinase [Trichococcus shcherbakoviae]|uniref:histidine kinase n=1 Tax=Trichococcus shcherbakoviae subsp. psychrophilus TaxID=2585775 RepID=A0A5C5EBM0_9LACT|nr:ATP-binding protein [Trichococcus shcherbakoviae]TNV70210.1 two-component sensor histidine kinase [Trichococcus shcherbakoviae subsp. psychrophilus]